MKNSIRRHMRCLRQELPTEMVRAAGEAVVRHLESFGPFQTARSVAAYVSIGSELPTEELIHVAWRCRKRLYLPRLQDGELLFSEHRPGQPLCAGAYGIPEPAGEPLEHDLDPTLIVFVPLLAWDETGARLGRGGGYYDRALAALEPSVARVGLGYELQQCASLPTDAWDVRLDYVLTERRVVHCTGGADPPSTRKEATQCHGLQLDWNHRRAGLRPGMGPGLRPAPSK